MNKKEGSGLGFSVAGGTDVEPKAVVVSDSIEMPLRVPPEAASGFDQDRIHGSGAKECWCLFPAPIQKSEHGKVILNFH